MFTITNRVSYYFLSHKAENQFIIQDKNITGFELHISDIYNCSILNGKILLNELTRCTE